MNDADAVTMNDETEELTVDYSNLIGGAMIVVQRLVSELSDCAGVDREFVIAQVREFIDDRVT